MIYAITYGAVHISVCASQQRSNVAATSPRRSRDGKITSFRLLKGCHITKTCLYHIDPLKPHFYTIKLGFTGVYIIFLISAQNHRLLSVFYLKIFSFWR